MPDYLERTVKKAVDSVFGGPSVRWLSAEDLPDGPMPDPVVEGLIPASGLTVLAGREKLGKSFFCLQLAVAVANGSEFLGLRTRRRLVYLLDLEGSPHRTADRLKLLGYEAEARKRLTDIYFCHELPGESGLTILQDVPRKSLVIIDTWARFLLASGLRAPRSRNAYEQDVALLAPLLDLAREKELSLLVVTHENKLPATVGS